MTQTSKLLLLKFKAATFFYSVSLIIFCHALLEKYTYVDVLNRLKYILDYKT